MIDMRKTVIAKSDQLNADDLLGQTKTIKVTKVSLLEAADQPIAIGFEGDDGKPYKPCKSMRRVMVNIWGPDGNAYIGRVMTLYRDEKVMFGGVATGGIRISHMSHIDGPVTMALTVARANRKPFTVQPLAMAPRTPNVDRDVHGRGNKAAHDGMDALRKFWTGLTKAEKADVGNGVQLAAWKAIAEAADAPDVEFDDGGSPEAASADPTDNGPAPGAATEPAGPGASTTAPAEAAPQGPLEGAAVPAHGAAAPSDNRQMEPEENWSGTSHGRNEALKARKAEIRQEGQARAEAGTSALMNYLEQLRENGESELVTAVMKTAWHETAKAAGAKGKK